MKHDKIFDAARKLYPGSKRGNANEFKNFVTNSLYPKKGLCKYDIEEVLPLLEPAIRRQIKWREEAKASEFRPEWKGFQVWVNDQYWEFEPPVSAEKLISPKMCRVCGGNATVTLEGKRYCPEHNPYKTPRFIKPEIKKTPSSTSCQGSLPMAESSGAKLENDDTNQDVGSLSASNLKQRIDNAVNKHGLEFKGE